VSAVDTRPQDPRPGAEPAAARKRIVVLISGRGSNMQALLEARLPAVIAAVISNVPGAAGLDTAHAHGVAAVVVDHRLYAGRAEFDAALVAEIGRHHPDLVVLAGFMRVLTRDFVQRYAGRMLNIHPSLLPAFPGLHTHRRALETGVRVHGCTVHFVTPELDHGPIVVQAAVPVLPGDTEEALAARVLEQEHRIYPQAVRWFCENRLRIAADGKVDVEGAIPATGALLSPATGQ
jgi:phosphoribosylglycinamide formyltransferase-1